MAEDSAAAKSAETKSEGKPAGKPIVLYALVILNMIVVAAVGAMLYLGRQKDKENAQTIDKAAQGMKNEAGAASAEGKGEAKGEGKAEGKEGEQKKEESDEYIGQTVPMETFLVNLSGSRGNKLLKVNMEFEVEGGKITEEIDKRKPQIRDIVIILLSSKTYAQLSAEEGKEFLRNEIRDTVNSFLTKGKIKRVLFTEFIFN